MADTFASNTDQNDEAVSRFVYTDHILLGSYDAQPAMSYFCGLTLAPRE